MKITLIIDRELYLNNTISSIIGGNKTVLVSDLSEATTIMRRLPGYLQKDTQILYTSSKPFPVSSIIQDCDDDHL